MLATSLGSASITDREEEARDPDRGRPIVPEVAGALGPLEIERAFLNLSLPRMVHLTHAGDGTGRIWVVLQPGRIMVFPNDRTASSADIFLDIRSQVSARGDEEGLLGLAFDPDYTTNGYFYVYYTAGNPRRSVVSRLSVSATDSNRAALQSELVLLQVGQPFSNHNGGTLAFGSDGYLYIGLGDGGLAGDPFGHGQNRATLLGSILRIDVSNPTAQEPYRIPPDNPFVGAGDGAREEIWAYGLRNPWRFSFDPATGDLWAGDVGQNDYEEVNSIRPGRNYGWNIMEGFHCYPSASQHCDDTGLESPLFEYNHSEGCSITGGHVYRGTYIPSLVGTYIYADFCSGRIWGLRYDGSTVTDQALLVDAHLRIPAIGTDEEGELYVLAYDGPIYRFVAQTPTRTSTATPTPAPAPSPTATLSLSFPTSPGPGLFLSGLAALAGLIILATLFILRRRRSP